ncbi:MAG: bifunctional DNA-formamidopyrimidine glycosylase/DNA-(apurinic or apyrimidinic site) lyase [Actinomycetota bacterium]|nr:bifunctional DNA-formamidopyrimidine glycosylase/DNA-(apurinic or apyrimidinic site) lyase [Actinomycetota bacterium]MED6327745.1 bifunctional DNA-formamidopyrimidine glycosylase/DNA-(apurinic or apyrimidinic site) lyase [Actinomycetota bacterium]MEE2958610.1 bifunctional DNA-formamidopyrimidine glycosylase/DNA-(apurinic or apyrimidinic site) lyase [Actinomycetota bacterium]
MPELPEVETVRRQLEPLVVGAEVIGGTAHPSPKFAEAIRAAGHRIDAVNRRGKYLLLELSPVDPSPLPPDDIEREMIVHLGMTGGLYVDPNHPCEAKPSGSEPSESVADPYERASWMFADGRRLWFRDVRRFGRIAVVPAGDHRSLPTLHHLGPEPFDPTLDAVTFHRSLQGSRRRIKTQLLSQRPVAGVGNIYADEALWRSRIHPGARRVGIERSGLLLEHLRNVLAESLDHGGTTIRDYRRPDGGKGRNQQRLDCYGRSGRPCRRCSSTLVARALDQRTTTWCPICQRN